MKQNYIRYTLFMKTYKNNRTMTNLENGYYWVKFKGNEPEIMQKDDYGWYAIGIDWEPDLADCEVIEKVSECNSNFKN